MDAKVSFQNQIYAKSPCKDCENRKPACHDHCEAYQQRKEENLKKKKWLMEQNRFNVAPTTTRFNWRTRKFDPPQRGVGRRNRIAKGKSAEL